MNIPVYEPLEGTAGDPQIAEMPPETEPTADTKPLLYIDPNNPDRTFANICAVLALSMLFFDRGVVVQVVRDGPTGRYRAETAEPDHIIYACHKISRPVKEIPDGTLSIRPVPLSVKDARMYLKSPDRQLPPLDGFSSAPLLSGDGSIRCGTGYDPQTGILLDNVPDISERIPATPSEEDAAAALRRLRSFFRTFPFADAKTVRCEVSGLTTVDLEQPPGADESSLLVALLTAVCRASLRQAPGLIIRAPHMSGAGTGKGLLVRAICMIAYGLHPHAMTSGGTQEELDKRITAALISGSQVLFLDNLNNQSLKSNLLASVLTEVPAQVRPLGVSQTVTLNSGALVAITGNAVTVSEDMARRIMPVDLDARMENPESRRFAGDILAEARRRREELLALCLMIWRWGRLKKDLPSGKPLGSFGPWCEQVRDPLLALGCKDPVDRVQEAKRRDEDRQLTVDILEAWWSCHGNQPMRAAELRAEVVSLIDPQKRSRQNVVAWLSRMEGLRIGGYMLTCQRPHGKWSSNTYTLIHTD